MKALRFLICLTVLSAAACAQSPSGDSQQPDAKKTGAQTAQEKAAPAETKAITTGTNLHLTVMKTIVAPSETTIGVGELHCDDDGNIYIGTADAGSSAIRKLNAKGELVASFKPDTNPDVKIFGAGHFFVTHDGEVYQWVGAEEPPGHYTLIFKNDGSYKSNIKLQPGFGWTPADISVFAHGELLMTGQQYAKVNDAVLPAIPFTGIFSTDGRLLKRLDLENDGQIKDAALASKAPPTAIPTDHTVTWGHSVAANDGNIYVMRYLSPAPIYAISPGGEVVRQFTVDPGSGGLIPQKMLTSGNRIAIFFTDRSLHERIIKIVDLEGNDIATYDDQKVDGKSEPAPLIALACYTATPEHFTFVSYGENGKIHLQQVEAH